MASKYLENFEVVNKKDVIRVDYSGKQLMAIKKSVFALIIKDFASKTFLSTVLGGSKLDVEKIEGDTARAKQLVKIYTKKKRIFYNNKKLTEIRSNTKEFKHFVLALAFIDNHDVDYDTFMDAQIEGLKFTGNFPVPGSLSTSKAEDRLLAHINNSKKEHDVEDFERIKLRRKDYETDAMENDDFVERFNKVEEGTATLREAVFCADILHQKRGFISSPKIRDYLDELGYEYERVK